MKILLIGSFDLYLHPYIEYYLRAISRNNNEYKVIYWNRSGQNCRQDKHFIPFQYKMDTLKGKIHKIKGYYKFYSYTKKIIKLNHFDNIVFLTTQTMLLFFNIARKQYKNKYIYDYRDVTFENNLIAKKIISKCILFSNKTIISSPGFMKQFKNINKNHFIMCHNDNNSGLEIKSRNHIIGNTIIISMWGLIRQPRYICKFIKLLKNDDRFIFQIFGTGYIDCIQKYLDKYNVNNVVIFGKYNRDEIEKICDKTDILFNCYSNNSIQEKALTVKMYDAIRYDIPMIVQKESFMDKYLYENGASHISIDIDNNEVNIDDLYNEIKTITFNYDKIRCKIKTDNLNFEKYLQSML